ncbi:hypothetical protein GCM10022247_23320 [Allokutzneria multivorans]|uniref:Uncharacterized protein n=1 Tax=Allokutzneria multivorans TaxID=1142134 RepID=A0ABP7RTK5_9PSEU
MTEATQCPHVMPVTTYCWVVVVVLTLTAAPGGVLCLAPQSRAVPAGGRARGAVTESKPGDDRMVTQGFD